MTGDAVHIGSAYVMLALNKEQSKTATPMITVGEWFPCAPNAVFKAVGMHCVVAKGSLESTEKLLKNGSLVIEREGGEVLFDGLVRKVPTSIMWRESPDTVDQYRFAEPFDVSSDNGVRFRLCLSEPSPGPVVLQVALSGLLAQGRRGK